MTDRRTRDRDGGLLTDHRRRLVIRYFQEQTDDTAACLDVARYVSTHSSGDPDPETVAARLHHDTLPRLEQTDLVEYDPESRTARYRGAEELSALVETFEK